MAMSNQDTSASETSGYEDEDVDLALKVSFEELRLNKCIKKNTTNVIIDSHQNFFHYPPLLLKSWESFFSCKNPNISRIKSSHQMFPRVHIRQFQHTHNFAKNNHKIHQPILINNRKQRKDSYFAQQLDRYRHNAIRNLAPTPAAETQRVTHLLQMLPNCVKGCYTSDQVIQFECTQQIRKLLSLERNPPIRDVIDSGVVPRIIEFLDYDNMERLQFEAAWCITNIASGAANNTQYVIDHGAVPTFVNLLKSKSIEIQEQSAWGLGNIAGDSVECRDIVLQENILDNLLPIFSIERTPLNLSLRRTITWTMSNLCRGKPSLQIVYATQIIEVFNKLLLEKDQDEEILQDTIWGYTYLFSDENRNVVIGNEIGYKLKTELLVCGYLREIRENELDCMIIPRDIYTMLIMFAPIADIYISSNILKRMIELLGHNSVHIRHPAVRAIHDILGSKTDTNDTKQLCIEYGMLKKLECILKGDRKRIKMEVCSLINNVVVESSVEIIDIVIGNGIIDALMGLLSDEKTVIKEALNAIGNTLRNGNDKHVEILVNKGVIEKIGKMKEPVLALMQCIERIIDAFNGKFVEIVKECEGILDLVENASFEEESDGHKLRVKLMSVL